MITTSVKTTSSETSSNLEIKADEATKREVGEFLVEQILSKVQSRRSPVTGEAFPPLSPDYKAVKAGMGLSPVPDLEQSGDMMDALDYEITRDGIRIGVFGKAAPRADGHNNLSGESSLPLRQFLPNEGEGFISSIEREVERIVADSVGETTVVPEADLADVSSSSSLYEILIPAFALGSRAETRLAVLRSPKWYNTLSVLGLLKWL